jgi:hypothetical protein
LILIMASRGMGRCLSQGLKEIGAEATSQRGILRRHAPVNHDAGSGPANLKEVMMRFYTEKHRFYCGIDLHARTMYLLLLLRREAARPPSWNPTRTLLGGEPVA